MSRNNSHYTQMGVDGYAKAIREALEQKDTYNSSLEITIHMLACSLRRYAQVQRALDNDDLLKVELTREHDERYKMNPLFPMLLHTGEQVRRYLRELKLTKALSGREGEESEGNDNELSSLVDAVKDAGTALGPRLPKKHEA